MSSNLKVLVVACAAAMPLAAHADWYFRGTPNTWSATPMTAVSATLYQTCQTFTTGDANGAPRFKIDRLGDWKQSYPATDYVVALGKSYQIQIATDTYKITVSEVADCSGGGGGFAKVFPSLYYRGTTNNWAATSMTLVADDTWETTVTFTGGSTQRFKVDVKGDWSYNFGDTNKDGVLDQTGADIYTAVTGKYKLSVNDKTKVYTLTPDGGGCANGSTLPNCGEFAQVFPSLFYRGTTNSWVATPMTLVADNTWETTLTLTGGATQRFKVDVKGDWTQNFGDTNKDGVLDATGADIYTASTGQYTLSVNDQTKAYKLTPVDCTGDNCGGGTVTYKVLGADYAADKTVFALWSPDKSDVKLVLDGTSYAMTKAADANGLTDIYVAEVKGDQRLKKYSFLVGGVSARDPYARMVEPNTNNAIVMDMSRTALPGGWADRPALANREDAVIYEMHVRDFTISPTSGVSAANRGKYLGMIESGTKLGITATGIDHLKELGVTHIQLMPVYDFGSCPTVTDTTCYNWGYDPQNFNVPEERYSLTPFDYENRAREFKQMVDAFHKAGIRVVMDVVYNHTYVRSMFDPITPQYYNAVDLSGTGNSLNGDVPMVSRMIRDSLEYWVKEYNIDGYRFDLVGAFSYSVVGEWANYLNAKFPDRTLLLYGEPWTGGGKDPNEAQRVRLGTAGRIHDSHFGVFNNKYREAIKGRNDDGGNDAGDGFAFNANPDTWRIQVGGRGAIRMTKNASTPLDMWDPMFAMDPEQTINYVSAHDNLTLRDKILAWADLNRVSRTSAYLRRIQQFANGIVFTSQGIPFLHGGEEMLRTKGGDHNSYKSPDSVNQIDWQWKVDNADIFAYYKQFIAMRRAHKAFRLNTWDDIDQCVTTSRPRYGVVVHYVHGACTANEAWKETIVIENSSDPYTYSLPSGNWTVAAEKSDPTLASRTVSGSVTADGTAVTVLFR